MLRLESVQNATDQAKCVARRLTGKPVQRQVEARNLLARELAQRGIQVANGSANFLLAYFGAAAPRIAATLAPDVLVNQPDALLGLDGWLRFTTQSEQLVKEIVARLDALLTRTFVNRGGLVSFRGKL